MTKFQFCAYSFLYKMFNFVEKNHQSELNGLLTIQSKHKFIILCEFVCQNEKWSVSKSN